MFSYQHFIWLIICILLIVFIVYQYDKKKPSLNSVLTSACVMSALSEVVKVFSVIELVPSKTGDLLLPYIPLNHLPLHFCSIQILLIYYVRFTRNQKMRENTLAFIYPTSIAGATAALLMPSIFTTSIPVEKAFISPLAYQFFLFHSMLVALGIIILKSKEIQWQKKHMYYTIGFVFLLGFISIYANSLFASPFYEDGKLVSVDFWTNFFFTYQNPLGIQITKLWHWFLYLFIISLLSVSIIFLFYYPLVFKKKRNKQAN